MSVVLAGVSPDVRWERRGPASRCSHSLISMGVFAVALVLSAGCSDGESTPNRLMDGSDATAPPVTLEGVEDHVVLTKVRVVSPAARGHETPSASCLERDWDVRPQGPSVERVGVASESVTFAQASKRAVFSCDNSLGQREENRPWCGGAYGRLYGGRLRDPRLSMAGCSTEDGNPIGFIWIDPGPRTKYLVVEQPEYAEVYEAVGRLPVRIATTSNVFIEGSHATFELSEHGETGQVIRTYSVDARVAG